MINISWLRAGVLALAALLVRAPRVRAESSLGAAASAALRINGPSVFGVRTGHPLLYRIPVVGARPIHFAVENLPEGIRLDAATGILSGTCNKRGEYEVTLVAENAAGRATKPLTIKVGDEICLTPPMGWNSWNCWAETVTAEQVKKAAQAMVASGLADHGWTYINIDDGWQGKRNAVTQALEGNEKFPDMHRLCDDVHALGLKMGLYSTPWKTSYAGFPGGSSDDPKGAWEKAADKTKNWHVGAHTFEKADADEWANWGVDYLKYDWAPIDLPHAAAIFNAARDSGRDIVISLSNAASIALAPHWHEVANCWRTTGDIGDRWTYAEGAEEPWRSGVSEIGFSQDPWAAAASPGHWNDPDMLVVGKVGWGASVRATHLSHDEQYTHFSLWCMLSAPLLIGCDLSQLDAFTLALLTNDEVIALDQDALGRPATRVATIGGIDIYEKQLEDGAIALGFFNRSDADTRFLFNKMDLHGLGGTWHVRNLWTHQNMPDCSGQISGTVPAHGVLLLRLSR